MKKYAVILACLTWALGTQGYAQTAGGGGGGAAGGGAVGGSAGGAAGALPPNGGLRQSPPPAVQQPKPGTGIGTGTPVAPNTTPGAGIGTRTPVAPNTTPGAGIGGGSSVGSDTAIGGGIAPGTGATGGTDVFTDNPAAATQPRTGTTADVQTGVTGARGAATPGFGTGLGTTTQPGVGTATDLALTQQIRAQLLNGGMGNAGATPGTATAAARARGVGTLTPQALSNVQLSANNGAVTLSGSVNTEAERRLLENRIRQVTGVQSVVNNLTVLRKDRTDTTQGVGAGTTTDSGVGAGSSGVGKGNGIDTVPSTGPSPR